MPDEPDASDEVLGNLRKQGFGDTPLGDELLKNLEEEFNKDLRRAREAIKKPDTAVRRKDENPTSVGPTLHDLEEPLDLSETAVPAPEPAPELMPEEPAAVQDSGLKTSFFKRIGKGALDGILYLPRRGVNAYRSMRARHAQERAESRPSGLASKVGKFCKEHKKAVAGAIGGLVLAAGIAYFATRPSKPYSPEMADLQYNQKTWKFPKESREQVKYFMLQAQSADANIEQKLLEADKADGKQDYVIGSEGIEKLK